MKIIGYILVLTALLVALGCKAQFTGKAVQELGAANQTESEPQEVHKTLVKEETNRAINKSEEKKDKGESCQKQVDDMKDHIDSLRMRKLEITSNLTKNSLLAQYLKNAYNEEDRYKEQLSLLDKMAKQKKNVESEIAQAKSALRILAEKCGIKVKSDFN